MKTIKKVPKPQKDSPLTARTEKELRLLLVDQLVTSHIEKFSKKYAKEIAGLYRGKNSHTEKGLAYIAEQTFLMNKHTYNYISLFETRARITEKDSWLQIIKNATAGTKNMSVRILDELATMIQKTESFVDRTKEPLNPEQLLGAELNMVSFWIGAKNLENSLFSASPLEQYKTIARDAIYEAFPEGEREAVYNEYIEAIMQNIEQIKNNCIEVMGEINGYRNACKKAAMEYMEQNADYSQAMRDILTNPYPTAHSFIENTIQQLTVLEQSFDKQMWDYFGTSNESEKYSFIKQNTDRLLMLYEKFGEKNMREQQKQIESIAYKILKDETALSTYVYRIDKSFIQLALKYEREMVKKDLDVDEILKESEHIEEAHETLKKRYTERQAGASTRQAQKDTTELLL